MRKTECSTGLHELDRVLGGGLVTGSLILVGGDPGTWKVNASFAGVPKSCCIWQKGTVCVR